LPALISIIVPTIWIAHFSKKNKQGYLEMRHTLTKPIEKEKSSNVRWIGILGLLLLLAVPISKAFFDIPVYILMLFAMAILWAITELLRVLQGEKVEGIHTVSSVLERIDTPSILFFVGLLLAIAALEAGGFLHSLMHFLESHISEPKWMMVGIGALSALVDNVPLVAAGMKMLPAVQYPDGDVIWYWLTFCAGTGGSLLVIGSAAGVAAMGMEQLSFGKYFRLMSLSTLLGLALGVLFI
jgi:Na+/H+ antiporter NhaD/arsenite permease-like protein